MVAYSEIKHNISRQAGKQAVFSENCILWEVKYILFDCSAGDNCCSILQHSILLYNNGECFAKVFYSETWHEE